jgi:hypothetical protein
MTHHPHIHMILPSGGLTPAGRWISSRPAFLLPVRVLGALFRRLSLTRLLELHGAGKLSSSAGWWVSATGVSSCADRQQVMTIAANEFIRRFLLHTLPRGFHRIRHYGLLAGSARKTNITYAR